MEWWNTVEENINDDQVELILSRKEEVISDNLEPPFITLYQLNDISILCWSKISDAFKRFFTNLKLSESIECIAEISEKDT